VPLLPVRRGAGSSARGARLSAASLSGPHLFLSPHLDDVAFSLGAALLDGRLGGGVLVNVFSVSNCTADDADRDVARVSALRRAEDGAFLARLPVAIDAVYLDRLDAPLRLGIAEDEVCRVAPPAPDDPEILLLVQALRGRGGGEGLLLAPLGLGGHVDHAVAHRAACALAAEGRRVAFYEDLPYAGGVELEEIDRAVAAAAARLGRALEPVLLPAGRDGERKVEAVAAYASQVDASTLRRIQRHGARLGGGPLAERLWLVA
jgi:LmbE family N-acetylglucosaminyl deacetylase